MESWDAQMFSLRYEIFTGHSGEPIAAFGFIRRVADNEDSDR